MMKRNTDWGFPLDMAALILAPIMVWLLAAILLPALRVRQGDPTPIYVALCVGLAGIVLLFIARLPLYRQHKFLTTGPKELTGIHRKLYWIACVLIVPSILALLFMVVVLYIG